MAKASKSMQRAKVKSLNRASKAALSAQRAQNYKVIKEAGTRRKVARKVPEIIKSVGVSVSNVTTPFAAARTTEKVAQEKTARQRVIADTNQANVELEKWKQLMSGNPDPETGSEGKSQDGSTSILD